MCFEYDMSHIDSKPRIHRPRADQASQTGGGQTQFLKEGMAADADQRGPGMAIRKLVFEKIMGKLWFLILKPEEYDAKTRFRFQKRKRL